MPSVWGCGAIWVSGVGGPVGIVFSFVVPAFSAFVQAPWGFWFPLAESHLDVSTYSALVRASGRTGGMFEEAVME